MAKFRKGDKVRQIMPAPVEGTIVGFSVDQETGDVQVQLAWTDEHGNAQGTFLFEHELEAAG